MTDDRFCARCKCPNPELINGTLPSEWEVLVDQSGEDIGVFCEGCITLGEERAMVDDWMDAAAEANDDTT